MEQARSDTNITWLVGQCLGWLGRIDLYTQAHGTRRTHLQMLVTLVHEMVHAFPAIYVSRNSFNNAVAADGSHGRVFRQLNGAIMRDIYDFLLLPLSTDRTTMALRDRHINVVEWNSQSPMVLFCARQADISRWV
jgi:hypothetical protein